MLSNPRKCYRILGNPPKQKNKSRKFVIHLHFMTVKNIYPLAIHVPDKEIKKLYTMLDEK